MWGWGPGYAGAAGSKGRHKREKTSGVFFLSTAIKKDSRRLFSFVTSLRFRVPPKAAPNPAPFMDLHVLHGETPGPSIAGPDGMPIQEDAVASTIIGAAIEVHRCLGPGLVENVYQTCLSHELLGHGIGVETQVPVPVMYKGIRMECGFRLDMLVARDVIVEIKSVDRLMPIHTAQIITYLRLTGARQALLINFNGATLKEGLKSFLGERNLRSH